MSNDLELSNLNDYQNMGTHIDNIMSLKNYLDNLVNDIQLNKTSNDVIIKVSKETERFFQNIENDGNTLTPKIVEMISDTSSENDMESDSSDNDSDDDLYQDKMQTYFKHSVYDDEPDFIDNDNSGMNINIKPVPQTPNNTPLNKTLLENYKKFQSEKQELLSYKPYSSQYPKQSFEPKTEPSINKNQQLVSDEAYDYLERLMKKNEESMGINSQPGENYGTVNPLPPTDIPKKPKDKLADEFLNNNLILDKYHYLKSFNIDRVEQYILSCSNY